MQEVHRAADACQHQGLFHGAISAANHGAGLPLVEVAVASGAAGDAMPAVLPLTLHLTLFAFTSKGPGRGATCYSHPWPQ